MDTLYLVMPAYNEAENIEYVIKQWYPCVLAAGDNSKLVVADSGSTDDTHEILLGLQKEFPGLEILPNTGQYHGPKVIALYNYAIANGADYVFQTDSDGQTNPDEFAYFWEKRDQYDSIIGNRTVRGDGKSRGFVEKVVCILLRFIFHVKLPDANAPFRLMSTDSLKKYVSKLPKDYDIPNIMISMYYVYYKDRVSFVPISFAPRRGGENSINIPRIIKIGINAVKGFYKLRKDL